MFSLTVHIKEAVRWYKKGKLEKSKEPIKLQKVEKDIIVIQLGDLHYLLTSWESKIDTHNHIANFTNCVLYNNHHISRINAFITKKLFLKDTVSLLDKNGLITTIKVSNLPTELLNRLNCEIES